MVARGVLHASVARAYSFQLELKTISNQKSGYTGSLKGIGGCPKKESSFVEEVTTPLGSSVRPLSKSEASILASCWKFCPSWSARSDKSGSVLLKERPRDFSFPSRRIQRESI